MELHLIAHNLRSSHNVGALFRTADSIGVTKLWLTGYTPTPANQPKMHKTALGAEASVAWEYRLDLLPLLDELKAQHIQLLGLELDERAVLLTDYHPTSSKLALLLGNEVEGIPPSLRERCDAIIALRQRGYKESMNVTIAAAIASHWLLNRYA